MDYQLELRHLRYFMAVAEELHFKKAADRLYISQPGLSRQIKNLEDRLGVVLFERNNRKVALTTAGTFLKTKLSKQFSAFNEVLQQTKLIHDGLLGELKLGYVGSAMQDIIPTLMVGFRQQYPEVLFGLKEMENTAQITALLNREIDIGFVRLSQVPKALTAFPIRKEPFCLVLPKDHPLDHANFTSLAQLKDESFILFDRTYSPSYYAQIMGIFEDSGFVPSVSHNTIHATSIYRLVEHHFGVSIVPKSLQSFDLKGVKFIELTNIPQRTTLSVVWNEKNNHPILHNFLGQLKHNSVNFNY